MQINEGVKEKLMTYMKKKTILSQDLKKSIPFKYFWCYIPFSHTKQSIPLSYNTLYILPSISDHY